MDTLKGSLEIVKLIINSVLLIRNAKFLCFDIKNFYLGTLLDRFEYVRVRFNEIPQEFIDGYNLADDNGDGGGLFQNHKGMLWVTPKWQTMQ